MYIYCYCLIIYNFKVAIACFNFFKFYNLFTFTKNFRNNGKILSENILLFKLIQEGLKKDIIILKKYNFFKKFF